MKRFRFALLPVAVVRAHQEGRALEAFATAVQRCLLAEQELATVRRRVAAFEESLLAGRRERYRGPAAACSVAGYCRQCAAELAAEKALGAARREWEQRRQEYLGAHRRLEVVRRLEEKARQAHRAAQQHEEQAVFDDLSAGRFARRVGAAPERNAGCTA
jgi:flagellar export protein FliJ